MLYSGDNSKVSFSGAGSSYGLRLASVGDGTSAEKESIAHSRLAVLQIIGVCSIEERNGFLGVHSGKIR